MVEKSDIKVVEINKPNKSKCKDTINKLNTLLRNNWKEHKTKP